MKKYKAILEENIVKVVSILADSQQEAEQKAKDLNWNNVSDADVWSELSVLKYRNDEEVLMDVLRADEGWVIVAVGDSYIDKVTNENTLFRIEKDDDCDHPFKDDICAIQFVIARMLEGSKLHIRAFKFAYANGSEDDRKVLQEELHYAILSK